MKVQGSTVKSRYVVGEFLGGGAFCRAYWALDSLTQSRCVIKFFTRGPRPSLYSNEVHLLRACPGAPCLPRLLDAGYYQDVNFTITDYAGVDLIQEIFTKNRVITAEALKLIAVQVLVALEEIHSKGFLHLDVKPDNILVDTSGKQVTLIDFGFSRTYMDEGLHLPPTGRGPAQGNAVFCSTAYIKGETPSRRSDIESLAYTLILLEKGKLPWMTCKGFNDPRLETHLRLRANFQHSDFYAKMSLETQQILSYALNLKYDEKPDYEYLRSLFATDLSQITFLPRGKMGHGQFYPEAFLQRNKSENRVSHKEESSMDLKTRRSKLVDEADDRRASLQVSLQGSERAPGRKLTSMKPGGPCISEEVRSRIKALRGSGQADIS